MPYGLLSDTAVPQDKKVYLKMLTILTLVGTVVGALVAAVGMLMQVGAVACVLAGCVLRRAAVGVLMQVDGGVEGRAEGEGRKVRGMLRQESKNADRGAGGVALERKPVSGGTRSRGFRGRGVRGGKAT